MGWKRTSRALLLTGSATIGLICANPALAQTQPTPPEHYALDERGVDLVRGTFTTVATDVVIGRPGDGGIAFSRIWTGAGWRDNLAGTVGVSGSTYVVSFGGYSEVFIKSGSTFTPVSNNGSTLTENPSAFSLTLTTSDGTEVVYSTSYTTYSSNYSANGALVHTATAPNGE